MKNINIKKLVKRVIQVIIIGVITIFLAYLGINIYVNQSTAKSIKNLKDVKNSQVAIVLGAHVYESGNLSPMLEDRVDVGVALYKEGKVKKILMSGDHGRKDYDEVNAMKNYAIKKGVEESDIFMDHAGFSTYESIYRAKYIFGIENAIISTQGYHLKRAVLIGNAFKINVQGIPADARPYAGIEYYKLRESFAICKDFINTITKPKPTYLGERIDITGNGNVTNG